MAQLNQTLNKPLNPYAKPFMFHSCKSLIYSHETFPNPPLPTLPLLLPPPLLPPVVGYPAPPQLLNIPCSLYSPVVFTQYSTFPSGQYHQQPSSLGYKDGIEFGDGKKALVAPEVVAEKIGSQVKLDRGGCLNRKFSDLGRKVVNCCRSVWMQKKLEPKGDGVLISSPTGDEHEVFLSGKTTVMIRNIPNKLSREDLVGMLDARCRAENAKEGCNGTVHCKYDFLYLPMDFKHHCNLGYAFVNFTTSGAAASVCKYFHKCKWLAYDSKKICEIGPGRLQGKEALEEHFRNSIFTCHTDDYLPVVFTPPRDGVSSCPPPKVVGKRACFFRKP